MHTILRRVQENIELRNLAHNTQVFYTRYIRRFFEHYPDKNPKDFGTEEIRGYLLYLKREKKRAVRTLDVAYAALKFLFNTVLEKPWELTPVPRSKSEYKLPVILSVEEIEKYFSIIDNIKHKAILSVVNI